MRQTAMALAFLACAAGPAAAQQMVRPDPERLAPATSLVEQVGVENILASPTHQYLRQLYILPFSRANPGREQEIAAAFQGGLWNRLRPIWHDGQVRTVVAGFYGQAFTVAELEELRRFFASPTGRKYTALSIEIADANHGLVARLMATQTAQGALLATLQDLERRGIRIPAPAR